MPISCTWCKGTGREFSPWLKMETVCPVCGGKRTVGTTLDGCTYPRHARIWPEGRDGKPVVVDLLFPGAGFRGATWYLFGNEFGPVALILADGELDAIEEWDEHYGERVHWSDTALQDYDGATVEQKAESAMNSGDMRYAASAAVWVNHYEWSRTIRPWRSKRKGRRRLDRNRRQQGGRR